MITVNDITKQVEYARKYSGLTQENYWLYVSNDGERVEARNNEKKREGYTGYFVEDDTRIKGIHTIIQKRVR